jgi:pimeloyl-ACP methyl ester carboxylesterase
MNQETEKSAGITNVVLVHGAWADGSGWEDVYRLLKADGYNVSVVQNPLTSFADDVAATRRVIASQDGPTILAGHSYGAVTVLQLALDAPGAVHSLALLEPPLAVPSAEAFFANLPPIAGMYESGDRPGAIETFSVLVMGEGCAEAIDRNLAPGWFEQAVSDSDTFFQVEVPALGEWTFGADDASRITQPVLSVVGENSAQFFREGHELLQQLFPQAETFVLPGATHALQMQNPRPLAEALAGFLARHPMREAAMA